jgi:hypothetical protein
MVTGCCCFGYGSAKGTAGTDTVVVPAPILLVCGRDVWLVVCCSRGRSAPSVSVAPNDKFACQTSEGASLSDLDRPMKVVPDMLFVQRLKAIGIGFLELWTEFKVARETSGAKVKA